MEATPRKTRKRSKARGRPGKTLEARENQLINLAAELAEKQLAEGTASAQVITHFLKLGTVKAQAELEKLKNENALLEAKTESLQSVARMEELYEKALISMADYQGQDMGEDETIED